MRVSSILLCLALALALASARPQSKPTEQQVHQHLQWMRDNQRGMMNIAPDEGRYLHDLVVKMKAKRVLEVGTSNGYSAIWMAKALQQTGGRLTTIELDENRGNLAVENFRKTGVEDVIDFKRGDALKVIPTLSGPFDLVFLDAWKQDYKTYLEMTYPMLRPGGVLAAHNVVSHREQMLDFLEGIQDNYRFKTEIVRVGPAGLSISYKLK